MSLKIVFFCLAILSCSILFSHNKFSFITTLYNETRPERMNEFITCLEKNLQHACIDDIHIFYDVSKDEPIILPLNHVLEDRSIPWHHVDNVSVYVPFSQLSNK